MTMKKANNRRERTVIGTRAVIIGILSIACLSCTSKNQPGEETMVQVTTDGVSITDNPNVTGETISKSLTLSSFHAVSNNTSVELIYTQGAKQKVTAEAPKALMEKLTFSVEDGVLTVRTKKHVSNINGRLKLYVTIPTLSRVQNNGAMTLHAKTWTGTAIGITNNGAFTLSGNIANKEDVKIQNNGSFSYKEGAVRCGNLSIQNNGSTTVTVNITATGSVNVKNNGSSNIISTVKAKSYSEDCDGATKDQLDIQAENLIFDIDGAGKCTVHFVGKNAIIHGDGSSKLDLDVDCKKLHVSSEGVAKITVKGTADETKFENDGVTKVDASGLNNL